MSEQEVELYFEEICSQLFSASMLYSRKETPMDKEVKVEITETHQNPVNPKELLESNCFRINKE